MYTFAVAALTALAAVSGASAATTPTCNYAQQQIAAPANNVNITSTYHGRTFPFTYCSGADYIDPSLRIEVIAIPTYANSASLAPSKFVLANANYAGSSSGWSYSFNITFPLASGYLPTSAKLEVHEYQYNQYNQALTGYVDSAVVNIKF